MLCQRCNKGEARVLDIEILEPGKDAQAPQVREHHLCEACAQALQLPHGNTTSQKLAPGIWHVLQGAHLRTQRPTRQCPECKMTESELRRRGKVGCARDYEVFADYLGGLIERMHGAREHCGRLPGLAEGELLRRQRIGDLKQRLEQAIREEDYECAASLRDELRALEHEPL